MVLVLKPPPKLLYKTYSSMNFANVLVTRHGKKLESLAKSLGRTAEKRDVVVQMIGVRRALFSFPLLRVASLQLQRGNLWGDLSFVAIRYRLK